jgi:hypothetical protein
MTYTPGTTLRLLIWPRKHTNTRKWSRLGHSAAATTLDSYGHALDRGQQTAADRVQALFTAKPKERKADGGA